MESGVTSLENTYLSSGTSLKMLRKAACHGRGPTILRRKGLSLRVRGGEGTGPPAWQLGPWSDCWGLQSSISAVLKQTEKVLMLCQHRGSVTLGCNVG